MFTFLSRLCRTRPNNQSSPRRAAFRPELEALQERLVPSVVSGGVNANSTFYIADDHKLSYDHVVVDLNGKSHDYWTVIGNGVAQVSVGTNAPAGLPTASETPFILFNAGSLAEIRNFSELDGTGKWHGTALDLNVNLLNLGQIKQIDASQATPDKVDVLFQNGQLWSHSGLAQSTRANPYMGWTHITDNVAKVQATQASVGVDAAVIRYQTGQVSEYFVPPNQKPVLYGMRTGIKDISAAPLATGGSVFLLDQYNNLWHHEGLDSQHDTKSLVAQDVAQMSAGDAYVQGLVYVLGRDNRLTEYYEGVSQEYNKLLADNVVSFSAVMPLGVTYKNGAFTLDNVFVQQTNGRLWEITGNQTYHYSNIQLAPHAPPITVHFWWGDVTEALVANSVYVLNDRYVYLGGKSENAATAVELVRAIGVD